MSIRQKEFFFRSYRAIRLAAAYRHRLLFRVRIRTGGRMSPGLGGKCQIWQNNFYLFILLYRVIRPAATPVVGGFDHILRFSLTFDNLANFTSSLIICAALFCHLDDMPFSPLGPTFTTPINLFCPSS